MRRSLVPIAALTAAAITVMGRQFAEPGVYSCFYDDTVYFLNWVRQVADGMASGLIYPRWMSDSHAGYGNPVFIFYPPLAVFASSVLMLLTDDISLSVTLVKFAGMLLSGIFMYHLLTRLCTREGAFAGAILYMLMPYRVYEMYFLGVHAAKLAYVWYPLILIHLHETTQQDRNARAVAKLGLSYGLLCLTHLLSAYMFLYVMAVYLFTVSKRGTRAKSAFYALSGVSVGLLVAGVFVIPALTELGLVHFKTLTNPELIPHFGDYPFDLGAVGRHAGYYEYMSMTIILTAATGGSALLAGRSGLRGLNRTAANAHTIVFILVIFLMTPLSGPVWDYVPGMKVLQFPTRWSDILVFSSSAMAALGVSGFNLPGARYTKMTAAALAAVFAIWGCLYTWESVTRGCVFTREELAGLPPDMDVLGYVPETTSLDWLREERTKRDIPQAGPLGDGGEMELVVKEWLPEERIIGFRSSSDGLIRVRTFYYPGWRAYGNDEELVVSAEKTSGAVLVHVPAGSYDVRLVFRDTPVRIASWVATASGLVMAVFMLIRRRVGGSEDI